MQKIDKLRGPVFFIVALMLLFTGVLVSRLFKESKPFQRSEYIMGTIFDITTLGGNENSLEDAARKAFAEIKRIDSLMSRYKEESEVSIINKKAGIGPVKVGQELIEVLKEGRRVSELSGGAFDVTIGPLSNLWGFDEEKKSVPPAEKIDEQRRLVDYRKLKIDEAASTVYLGEKGMMIDVGGIAKGYALKKAMKVFEEAGIRDVIINAGGNLNLRGGKKGKPWKIGIQDARNEKKLLGVLNITETSVSTSGDYQRFFIKDGVRYHHILDPKTGSPAKGLVSVTVVGRNEAMTDAMSTAVFVLGLEKGTDLIKKAGAEGIIVREDGTITVSDGLKEKFSRKP
ncbi:FAD:protein FMN transferase [Pseudomonas sp.]|uniref:FAD:protein FMN transferase n=1 Tax=Pseudomonas sp. TaxID=306 RepID=UPI002720EBC2|nr:FAD:protein FMN transferase [Pseudomonas sp.]MDO8707082.1 FAD:protein FMN transferase [Pseudomonas sp.]